MKVLDVIFSLENMKLISEIINQTDCLLDPTLFDLLPPS